MPKATEDRKEANGEYKELIMIVLLIVSMMIIVAN